MGSPDLPGNENDRRRQFQPPPSNELPMHGQLDALDLDALDAGVDHQHATEPRQQQNGGDGGGGGEDAADSINPYVADGYHPLNFEPTAFGDDDDDDDEDSDADEETTATDEDDEERTNAATAAAEQLADVPDEAVEDAPVNRIDRDLLRQVWNQPRPAELDIEIYVEKIKSVMASVTLNLGNIEAPAWANAVSGAELLAQLGRQHPAASGQSAPKPPSG